MLTGQAKVLKKFELNSKYLEKVGKQMHEHEIVNFLGIDFDVMQRESVIMKLLNNTQPSFYYIVTPNADHVVRYHEDIKFKLAYDKAKYRICDSKILWLLAMITKKHLSVTPGADLAIGLINNKFVEGRKLMVLGPSLDQFEFLKRNYPKINWLWTKAPENLVPGTKKWEDLVSEVSDIDFDLLLCCLSSPKQEIFCYELELSNNIRGMGLCFGASIDFITGKQKRAPAVLRWMALEWAYRLCIDPRRMAKRYLIRSPKVFKYFVRSLLGSNK